MNIIICDDDIQIAEYISKIISEYKPDYAVETFRDADSLISYVNSTDTKIDLLFMDIVLNDKNGIDLAAKITEKNPETLTVFITAFTDKYSEEIFLKVKPYGYLHKPIKNNILYHYLDSAKHDIDFKKQKLSVKIGQNAIDIPFRKIIYIESEKRLSHIFCSDTHYDTYAKLDDIQKNLNDTFIRCHKSYLVNSNYIKTIEKDCFVLKSGTTIPISKAMSAETRINYFKVKGRELR